MKWKESEIADSSQQNRLELRRRIEKLQSMVSLLEGQDRVLMTLYLENGINPKQLAQLVGVTEDRITRRIRRITKRLINEKYITCLRERKQFTCAEIKIARDHFLLGLSIKAIAQKRRCSYYSVRESVQNINKVITAIPLKSNSLIETGIKQ